MLAMPAVARGVRVRRAVRSVVVEKCILEVWMWWSLRGRMMKGCVEASEVKMRRPTSGTMRRGRGCGRGWDEHS